MARYRIYATASGVFLKSVDYGSMDDADIQAAVASDLENLGVGDVDPGEISKTLDNRIDAGTLLTEEKPENFPGACWVEVDSEAGDAILTIVSSIGDGRSVEESDIMSELQAAGAGDYIILQDNIRQAIEEAGNSGEPYSCKIAELRNVQAQIEISPDRLEVRLVINDPNDKLSLTVDGVLGSLGEKGVVFGILSENIEQILSSDSTDTSIVVARGHEPVNGEDGRIKYHFDAFQEDVGPRIMGNDIADFKDLGLFESVKVGDLLATIIPPTYGEDGTDVLGDPVKAIQGKEIASPAGKNTAEGEDPNTLVATSEGQPKIVAGKVIVDEVLDIRGDIDLSTGNVNFVGSVVIRGAVSAGFKVKAGDSVTCLDVVEGAEIEAGGDVILKWGMKGQNRATINAGGDVTAKFIESSRVVAGGSVIVDDFILHSDVRATREVRCTGKKGWISGGHASAGQEVNCKILGNESGTKTKVEVGVLPKLREDHHLLKKRLAEIAPKLEMMSKTFRQLEELKEKGALGAEKEEMRNKVIGSYAQLEREYEQAEKQLGEISETLNSSENGKINVSEIAHPGVLITVGNVEHGLNEPLKRVTFTSDDSGMQIVNS